MRIGLTELLLIAAIILAMVRPDKLKEYSASLGRAVKAVREGKEKAEEEVFAPMREDIAAVKEVVDEVREPIDGIVQPVMDAAGAAKDGMRLGI